MTKDDVRKRMRLLRKNMTEQERKEKDALILNKLFQLETFQKASCFFSFVSYGTEVDTRRLIQKLLEQKEKRVAVPKVEGREINFYYIRSFGDLDQGYMGILEPVTSEKAIPYEGIMLMPGLAFDLKKNRIGYGGGYYDRYLETHSHANMIKIALAYDFQVMEHLETKPNDQQVDMILTDLRTIED